MAPWTELHDGGLLRYEEGFFDRHEADRLFETLRLTVSWRQEVSRGKPFPRLTAWYADPGFTYSYSGVTHQPEPWTPELQEIRRRVEAASGADFNSLLLNYYRTGQDSIGFHADDEPELGRNPVIASVSFGAVRDFILKHKKTRQKLTLPLAHGSLLIMAGTCQHFWIHSLPKRAGDIDQRINLTFRRIILG
jgi:alkylated DNA repair dioxygenase AlkB